MDPSALDLNLLRTFDAVLRERSVTGAGAALGLTQPAVSNALGRLRALLGDALFVRTPGGMRPTPLAQEISGPIRQALALIDATVARERGFEPSTSSRNFRFYMSDIGEMVFLPPLLERVRAAAPGVRVETLPMPESALPEALLAGDIDFAVGFLPNLGAPLRSAAIFSDPYMALTRAGHPHIGRTLTRRSFAEASHALVQSSGSGHRVIEEALRANDLERRIVLRVPHFTVVPMILERTDLVACVPARVALMYEATGRFRACPLPVPVRRAEVRIFWNERFEQDPGSRWMRDLMVELHADAGAPRRGRTVASAGTIPRAAAAPPPRLRRAAPPSTPGTRE